MSTGKRKSILGPILTIIGIVVLYFCIKPIALPAIEQAKVSKVTGAAKNAYTVYLYADTDHVSHPKTLKIVGFDYVGTVENNDMLNATYEKLEDTTDYMVTFDKEEATGVYEEGIYVTWEEGERIVQHLEKGDSLKGLHRAYLSDLEFEGFEYYGMLEKCDVYVKK